MKNTEAEKQDLVASPCIQVCRIEPATGWCAGCWRSLEEVAAWSSMADSEKRMVLQKIEGRKR